MKFRAQFRLKSGAHVETRQEKLIFEISALPAHRNPRQGQGCCDGCGDNCCDDCGEHDCVGVGTVTSACQLHCDELEHRGFIEHDCDWVT